MGPTDSPFFSVLRAQLDHLGQRQRVVTENIANATTPGFTPRDTDEKSFERILASAARQGDPHKVRLAATQPGHVGAAMTTGSGSVKVVESPDSETTIDGNQVVLEEQMLKAAETRMAYETSLALYQKGLTFVRMAIKSPSR